MVILSIKESFQYTPSKVHESEPSYREVFQNRVFLKVTIGGLIYTIFGYASLNGGIAIYLTQNLHLSPKWVAIVLTANTVSIFFLQGLVLRAISRRNKFEVLTFVGWIWALSWVFVAIAAIFHGFLAGILVSIGQIVFAIGEMIWSPVMPTIINNLAPENLRGRYNALGANAWQIAGIGGPMVAGALIGAQLQWLWIGMLVLFLVIAGGAAQKLNLRTEKVE